MIHKQNRKNKKTLLALLALLALAAPSLRAQERRDIRLVEIEGLVWVRSVDQQEWQPVAKNQEGFPLEEGDRVKTGDEPSHAVIQIDQDNTFELSAKTEFEVSVTLPVLSKFRLFMGRIFAKIDEKLTEKKRKLNVIMPVAVLAVRGTEFTAEATPEETTAGGVGVFEGSVEATFTNLEGKPSVAVDSGNELDLVTTGAAPRPRALKRYLAMKQRIKQLRKRHARLRARWRMLPIQKRKLMRERIMRRVYQRRFKEPRRRKP